MSDLHWTETSRNGLTLIREIAVIGTIGVFFFAPAVIGVSMGKAGLEKLAIPGFGEIVAQAEAVKTEAEAANVQIAIAQEQVEDVRDELKTLAENNPAVRRDVRAINNRINISSQELAKTSNKIATAVRKQEQLVTDIRKAE